MQNLRAFHKIIRSSWAKPGMAQVCGMILECFCCFSLLVFWKFLLVVFGICFKFFKRLLGGTREELRV